MSTFASSMENLTPGRKLILDLLAKSVAKIQAAEAKNEIKMEDVETDGRKRTMKRETMEVPVKLKKIKAEKKNKVNVDGTKRELKVIPKPDHVKTEHAAEMDVKRIRLKKVKCNEFSVKVILGSIDKEPKTEEGKKVGKGNGRLRNVLVETPPTPDKIKIEYTEVKTEEIDLESYATPEIKGIKLEEKFDNENKIKLDNFERPTIWKDSKKKEPVKQSKTDLTLLSISKDKLNVHEEVLFKEYRDNGQKGKFRKITSRKKFSIEEDQTILSAIEKSGDKIDVLQIAADLQRTETSVLHEVRQLKAGKEKKTKTKRQFTLSEDIMLLDAVLQNLGGESLEVVSLTQSEWRKVGTQIGKEAESLRTRWTRKLRPWILQHYAGTLNLEIRRPLSNYAADNYADVNSIDWSSVTEKPEFAGHTVRSLRGIFSQLLQIAKESLHKNCEDITLEMVAEVANTKYAAGERKVLDRDLKRQQDIIDHFECYVKTHCITDFL